jgi:hypothetical protein
MLIDRRNFILNTTLVASAPALAGLLSLSSTLQAYAELLPRPLTNQIAGGGADMNFVAFKIHGWDRSDDIAINGSKTLSADPMSDDPNGDPVWISVNRSWKAAWR